MHSFDFLTWVGEDKAEERLRVACFPRERAWPAERAADGGSLTPGRDALAAYQELCVCVTRMAAGLAQ